MNLTNLKCGETCIIKSIPERRMAEFGLIKGLRVRLISKGPFSDPLELEYFGSRLLIDHATASKTEVILCNLH